MTRRNVFARPTRGAGVAFVLAVAQPISDGAFADGVLDESVGELGHRDNHDELRKPNPPGNLDGRAHARGEQDDGEMPQVHPVAALADPYERRQLQKSRNPGVRHDEHGDEHGRQHADQGDSAPIGEGAEPGREYHDGGDSHERRDAGDVEGNPGSAATLGARTSSKRAGWPRQREPRAHEQAHRARIGAVIHATRICRRAVHQRHLDARSDGKDEDYRRHGPFLQLEMEQRDEQQRPDYVELLLDGKAPEMRERRRRAGGLEIRDLVEYLPPVVVEQKRRQDIGPSLVKQRRADERGKRYGASDGQQHRGHDAAHASQPELR